jgi:Protein of unknown function (DUF2630)
VDDRQVLSRVGELVAEEHQLRGLPSRSADQQARLAHIEEDLDQCWDLLRQRRARREFGQNPDNAQVRPHSEVDSYLQ